MITLKNYGNVLSHQEPHVGKTHLKQADMIMERTWNLDPQTKDCYIYDYFHDDPSQANKNRNIIIDDRTTNKTAISCKYVVIQYGSLSKDQVEYHLQFKPSQECVLDYYKQQYENVYDMEYPIGMYIDIPDEKGVYRKWLICSRDRDLQFISYSILPCNYYFYWTKNNVKYKMWGIARLRNSYNSGIWTDYKITNVENQDQIWLPTNAVSDVLYYDDRLIISAPRQVPNVWKVTKVENIHPQGLNKLTLGQDKFDPHKDYIPQAKETVYEMYADYYTSSIIPESFIDNSVVTDDLTFEIKYSSKPEVKVNGGYKNLDVVVKSNSEQLSFTNNNWTFTINDTDVTNLVSCVQRGNDFSSIKIKFLGDESYLRKILKAHVTDDSLQYHTELSLNITSL